MKMKQEPTRKGVLYCRVSDPGQRDGYSIDAQSDQAQEFAARHGIEIVKDWYVQESAKEAGRKAFGELLKFMRATPSVSTMLFEKPDRMTRNYADLVAVYELIEERGKDVYFFKTGQHIDKDSKSSDLLQLDMHVVMARAFITNLREEVRKGMGQKVKAGGFPAVAPVGFTNNVATRGIDPDPEQGPLVKRLFQMYGTGRYSLSEIEERAAKMGIRNRRTGRPLSRSAIHGMLGKPFYYGLVRWGGQEGMGSHVPLISKALFDRVQEVLGGESRPRNIDFAFRGLAVCGSCGSGVTAERHTKRQKNGNRHVYVYYHCTGWKNSRKICRDAYLREEDLVEQLGEPLRGLVIDRKALGEIQKALRESFAAEKEYSRARLVTLQAEETRLKNRLDQAYADKLDGLLPADEYVEKSRAWRGRLIEVREELARLKDAHDLYLEEASRILDLARDAYRLYQAQKDNYERRKLIDLMVSKVVISGKKAVSNLREPFDSLSKLALAAKSGGGRPEWYPGQGSNL